MGEASEIILQQIIATAIVNSYAVFTISTDDLKSGQSTSYREISKILKPDDDPIIIRHSESIDKMYGSSGELYFSVVYDNGLSEASMIKYKLKN